MDIKAPMLEIHQSESRISTSESGAYVARKMTLIFRVLPQQSSSDEPLCSQAS